MRGKDFWYGKEVEGRLYGIYTLFNRNKLGIINDKVKHLYFTIEFWNVNNCIDIMEEYMHKYPVSIEVDNNKYNLLTPNLKVNCHIIYRIKDKNVFDLKNTDSIFIDGEIFNVLCFNKYNAMKVNYIDYSNDKEC